MHPMDVLSTVLDTIALIFAIPLQSSLSILKSLEKKSKSQNQNPRQMVAGGGNWPRAALFMLWEVKFQAGSSDTYQPKTTWSHMDMKSNWLSGS